MSLMPKAEVVQAPLADGGRVSVFVSFSEAAAADPLVIKKEQILKFSSSLCSFHY